MDRRRLSRHQCVEFAKRKRDEASVETGGQLYAGLRTLAAMLNAREKTIFDSTE
jgi:hypothetical protein